MMKQQQQQGERVELHEGASPGTMENSEMEMKIQINDQYLLYNGLKKCGRLRASTAKERISRMPPTTAGKRSSIYRGVTRHRWTGRYEAHLWDKTSWNENQNKKGKQVYLGAYDEEEAAARAYDLAALKYWGAGTQINFPLSDYTRDLDDMKKLSRDAYLQSLRKRSNSVSRGLSKLCRHPRQPYSQWDMNTGNCSTGINVPGPCEYVPGYGLEPRIDLTSHIKWKPLKERWASISKGDLLSEEGKTSEWLNQPMEPYQLPSFGNPLEGKEHSYVSACDILSKSVAFKNLEEKVKAMKMNETVDYALHVSAVGAGESEAPLGVPGMGMFDPQSAQCTLLPDPTMMDGHIDLTDALLWNGIASSAFSLQSAVPCLHLQEHDPESGYIV